MKTLKKEILLLVLLILGLADICLYWNSHLLSLAKEKIGDNETKIKVLEKANKFYPFNDVVHYELGKAYFDLGMNNLGNSELRNDYLQESSRNFNQSLRINSTSLFAHFHLAQSFLYMNYLSLPADINCYEEYKKAALLTGHNTQIFYEVGKILLSRWSFLSEGEKDFATEILKKILISKEKEKLLAILQIWDMNVKDYTMMEKILQEDADAFRLYAQFLGEKSLSLEERQKMMARAEFLDFERAKSECHLGQREFQLFHIKEAFSHFLFCLETMRKINFYQNLIDSQQINLSEYKTFLKSVYLNLAKCRLEETRKLEEAEGYLRSYLALEDEVGSIGELQTFLQERNLIGNEALDSDFKNFDLFSFQILLNFKRNKYGEIIKVGNLLPQSIIFLSDSIRKNYVEVLQLIGDSFHKLNYVYESDSFYQKALEMDEGNLDTLLRIRKNYERLNEEEEMREIDKRIESLMTAKDLSFTNLIINKGQVYSHPFILDGRKVRLTLHFGDGEQGVSSLISVFFNDRIVWEDYLKDNMISISLSPEIGPNTLKIIPVNRPISLLKMSYILE